MVALTVRLRRLPPILPVFFVLLALLPSQRCWAGEPCCACPDRPGDEIWLVSTRHLGWPCGTAATDPALCVCRYDCRRGCVRSTKEELLAGGAPESRTVIYVHGSRVDQPSAFSRAIRIHQALAPHAGEAPLRVICWSWPTPSTIHPLQDFQASERTSDQSSYYLAWFLAQVDPATKIGLVGFSFGPRVIAGALHLSAGGALKSLTLNRTGECPPVRVVFWAAAVHNYWLLPDSRYGRAMDCVDRMLIAVNSCDPVLKRYHLLDERSDPDALGFTGPAAVWRMNGAEERISVFCSGLGKSHSSEKHISSGVVIGASAPFLLWEDVD